MDGIRKLLYSFHIFFLLCLGSSLFNGQSSSYSVFILINMINVAQYGISDMGLFINYDLGVGKLEGGHFLGYYHTGSLFRVLDLFIRSAK